eukprot:tig00000492_g1529.t1
MPDISDRVTAAVRDLAEAYASGERRAAFTPIEIAAAEIVRRIAGGASAARSNPVVAAMLDDVHAWVAAAAGSDPAVERALALACRVLCTDEGVFDVEVAIKAEGEQTLVALHQLLRRAAAPAESPRPRGAGVVPEGWGGALDFAASITTHPAFRLRGKEILSDLERVGELLLQSLELFYDKEAHRAVLENILVKREGPSLRLFDWLCTNYAKKHDLIISDPSGRPLKLHNEYKRVLKSYSKRNFDPFCRRFPYHIRKGDLCLRTSIGQMNFFRWAIQCGVVAYARENLEAIEGDMNSSMERRRALKREAIEQTGEYRRSHISDAPKRSADIHDSMGVTIRFH